MSFGKAIHSGLSVGVPGVVAMLHRAHSAHGVRPWSSLFDPAIARARSGFEVSPRLNGLLGWMGAQNFGPRARAYFFDATGAPRSVGHRLRNEAFADTLSAIASGGPSAFYEGAIAADIVDAVAKAPNAPGDLTQADLTGYEVKTRAPVCMTYRGYKICGMGPPSSGALTVAQTLALVEKLSGIGAIGPNPTAAALHAIAEAQKLSFADRGRYIADPDAVTVPKTMLDVRYLDVRRALINPREANPKARPGIPPGVKTRAFGLDATRESSGTSHISIVDGEGNVVSMTTTIESAFGSRIMVRGFLLNNELTDFSFLPTDDEGRAVANRVGPGKRPRSSMAPTIVFRPDGSLFATLGSPGGSRIILYVTKALVGLIDWKLDAQAAASFPNFGSRGGPFELEGIPATPRGYPGLGPIPKTAAPQIATGDEQRKLADLSTRLEGYGHKVVRVPMTSGLQIIVRRASGLLEGGADPRREGVARGD